MRIGYRITERFNPETGEKWKSYQVWSGLSHLLEVVSLDSIQCPPLISRYTDEDLHHLEFADYLYACFGDLEYALRRAHGEFDPKVHQILALAREPTESEVLAANLPGFRFKGFDLIDNFTSISALTNCGGSKGVFLPADLSPCGLILSAPRAYEIQKTLAGSVPRENHATFAVWSVWRHENA